MNTRSRSPTRRPRCSAARSAHASLLPAVLFALPVIRMARGMRWQVALLVGLLYALPMNMFHFIPNDLMAPSVRLSHFIETASSNFIFGLLVAGLLLWVPVRAGRLVTPLAGQ